MAQTTMAHCGGDPDRRGPRRLRRGADKELADRASIERGHDSRRMRGRDPGEQHRTATPLKLLFDLTFAASFGLAAHDLASVLAAGLVVRDAFWFQQRAKRAMRPSTHGSSTAYRSRDSEFATSQPFFGCYACGTAKRLGKMALVSESCLERDKRNGFLAK